MFIDTVTVITVMTDILTVGGPSHGYSTVNGARHSPVTAMVNHCYHHSQKHNYTGKHSHPVQSQSVNYCQSLINLAMITQ